MSDYELLERAAMAVNGGSWHPLTHKTPNNVWNPLTDDGDALRLAVKLRLQIAPSCWECCVYVPTGENIIGRCSYGETKDMAEATRRAIVRAAAAMADGGR